MCIVFYSVGKTAAILITKHRYCNQVLIAA